jgi:ferritin
MLSKSLEEKLNMQIEKEAYSSQLYLAMASWAETKGYAGVASFLYGHADEERLHMLKIVHYINERGGHALVPSLEQPDTNFNDLRSVFERILKHEESVSQSINDIVDFCLKEKDHSTNNFMQWYVSEQMEEESLAKSIIEKLDMIGADSTGLYFFDRELGNLKSQN